MFYILYKANINLNINTFIKLAKKYYTNYKYITFIILVLIL